MAIIPATPKATSRLSRVLTTDFCPWANRFVYWLKEPIGWFVIATSASVLVGAFLSPQGWTLAAGLSAVMIFGMGFPWLATRCVSCQLHPVCDELHERETSTLQLQIRNYLPLPIMGLMVEGYLTGTSSQLEKSAETRVPEAALERIPACSTAVYRLPISAEYRGQYPQQVPRITCAFPFGIWTAKREIHDLRSVTILPLLIPLSSELEFAGDQLADVGIGQRASTHGDFLAVREFRRGDSLKNIHWVQSARQDQLVVCERGGPQNQAVELHLATTRCHGSDAERRENLAWRVRITASLISLLSARHLPYRLIVDGKLSDVSHSANGYRSALQRLAHIPLDGSLDFAGVARQIEPTRPTGMCWIAITPGGTDELPSAAYLHVEIGLRSRGLRQQQNNSRLIDLDSDITGQLNHWLSEAMHV